MSSHELNKRIPNPYPNTPDLARPAPAPSSAGEQGVQPFAPAPIRPAADYDSDSDDDPDATHTGTRPSRAHRPRPSAAGLLASRDDSSGEFGAGAGARAGSSAGAADLDPEAERAKARRIEEYDAPVQPLLDENLTAVQKVRAFVKLNEGESGMSGRVGGWGEGGDEVARSGTRSEPADGV